MHPEGTIATATMTPSIYRVSSRRDELPDTVTLELRPVDRPLASPAPGQFAMLWAFGIGEVPISLAGLRDDVLTHTIRRVGAVTTALCDVTEGDSVGVRGPFGTGWDLARAVGRDLLIIAGGLGLAPLRPLVLEVLANREDYNRVALLVGGRSPDQLLYLDEITGWADELDVDITVDTASPSWPGHVGFVTKLVDGARVDPERTTAFVCGPEVMMRLAAEAAVDRGIPAAEVLVSLERNMQCAIGHCGHCQLGPFFLCKEGPVLSWQCVEPVIRLRGR